MKHIMKKFKSIWRDESAQGATEYILLLVVIIALVAAFRDPITQAVSAKISQLSQMLGEF